VSRQVRTRAMLARTSQRVRGNSSIPALANPSRRLRNWPSIPSPQYRLLAWRDAEDDAKHWNARSTRYLLLQPEAWQATGYGSTAVQLHRHPYIGALQTSVSIERQFSRIFPAHPRSLARCLSRARRHGASLLRLRRPVGFGFQKIFVQRTQKDFPNLPKKTPLGLGSGAHSRRFAQECPEGNPGKYNQGEKQWRSTKTRSL
jgi:hypothetical protein